MISSVNCQFIKLQWYSEHDLYGSGDKRTKLNLDWMPTISDACVKANKKLLCTVFNSDRVRKIDKFVSLHKIASSEITDINLLTQIRDTKKGVIVSTGGASKEQISKAIEILGSEIRALLACDVEYPSKRHTIRRMMELYNSFPNFYVGYSDHSLDIYSMPILAQHYNAIYYEKHVKPNVDHSSYEQHALTIDEFNEMVSNLSGKFSPEPPVNKHQRIFDSSLAKWVRPRV
jgi:sialic acid synthase SpsE